MDKNLQKRLQLISRHTEEILTEEDLVTYLKSGQPMKHYIGLEISGRIHLGTGLMSMYKVKDLVEAGIDCTVFLADWHTWINDKLGGDRDLIKRVANGYFKEGLKASLRCLGANTEKVNFLLGTELYRDNEDYWATVIEVSKNTSLARMQRSITILGRQEGETVDFAKLIYPAMQVADIFIQGLHIAHAGLDQRKAHVIARDTALQLKIHPLVDNTGHKIKPVAVHHHLILGLGKPPVWPPSAQNRQELWSSMKMSKSEPDSAIFIDDSPEDIQRKVKKAFCPPGEIEFNPILDWTRYLVFYEPDTEFHIDRLPRDGGPVTFTTYEELETAYVDGRLHPMDLKNGITLWLIETLEPVRQVFKDRELHEVSEQLKTFTE